jgi:hypothetical protein
MDFLEAIDKRHSVRKFTDKAIPDDILSELEERVEKINKEQGLHFILNSGKKNGFDGIVKLIFKNVAANLMLCGKSAPDLFEKCGYYGEELVLLAQTLGLNSCWAMMAKMGSKPIGLENGEEYVIGIALGYGQTQGRERKTKSISELSDVKGEMPEWFQKAMVCVQKAPTAVNQQKFVFGLDEDKVTAKSTPGNAMTKIDLGIAKYHFMLGAGEHKFVWL